MKETIAKRNKKPFLLMLAISLFALALCVVNLLTQYNLKVLYIVGICLFGLASIVWLIFIISNRGVIERQDNLIVVRIGLFKKATLKLRQITDVTLATNPQNASETLTDAITIKYVVKKKHGQIDCGGLLDAPAVVETLKAMIGK